jgi:hypothetical protein
MGLDRAGFEHYIDSRSAGVSQALSAANKEIDFNKQEGSNGGVPFQSSPEAVLCRNALQRYAKRCRPGFGTPSGSPPWAVHCEASGGCISGCEVILTNFFRAR